MARTYSGDELQLPETTFVRDIEDRVFQSIVWQCVAKISGIQLCEGGFIDHWLHRGSTDRLKSITVSQSEKNNAVSVRVEVNVAYDVSIPEKAEEVQVKVAEEITRLTGLHVARVHVVFKGIMLEEGDLSEEACPSDAGDVKPVVVE